MKKKNVLIFGSGSIGTHHANAAISLKNNVYITDKKKSQLINMVNNIYPSRYGSWNKNISCIDYKNVFELKNFFDLIIIGVPPKFHLSVLKTCIKNLRFKKVLIEKPLCVYNQNYRFLKKKNIAKKIYCGFNHSVSQSFNSFLKKFKSLPKKNITINITWKESFDLVLKAHPWLRSLGESYLSNVKIGGGVAHEYSHALHIFLILKMMLFKNENPKFLKKISYKKIKTNIYDNNLYLSFRKNKKTLNLYLNGTNNPPIKKIEVLIGNKKKLTWVRKLDKNLEIVEKKHKKYKKENIKISRRGDFIQELKLLLFKNKDKSIEFLRLDYSIMVMTLLKSIFRKNV